jgi:PAS domain S-box-containing protein
MLDTASIALRVVNHISAMVAYWDVNQRCVFANEAYREWFGRTPREMAGISMQQLLGPLYVMNLPHIEAALRGERQVFERRIPLPDGSVRETIATYTPDIVEGRICGFSAHVADVTSIKEREVALIRTVQERDRALAAVKTLEGLLPICAGCKNIRDKEGHWHSVESYVSQHSSVNFSHGMCPSCVRKYYPELS